jgi:hypothetical protein
MKLSLSLSMQPTGGVAAVPTGVPVNTVAPTISGIQTVGEVATGVRGSYTNFPTSFTQRWLRNSTAIPGETAITHTWVPADAGQTITFEETPSNVAFGAGAAAISAGVVPAAALAIPSVPLATGPTGAAYSDTPTVTGGHQSGVTNGWSLSGSLTGSGLSFSTATGALTATSLGPAATYGPYQRTYTDADGLTVSQTPFSIVVSAFSLIPGNYDDFSASAGVLNGQPLVTGGLSWALQKSGGTNVSAPALSGSGELNVNGGTASRGNAAYITPASVTPNRRVAVRRATSQGDVTGLQEVSVFFQLAPVTASTFTFLGFARGAANGTATATVTAGTTGQALFSPNNFNVQTGLNAVSDNGGDIIEWVWRQGTGSQRFLDIELNGRQVGSGTTDLSATVPTINDVVAIQGGNVGGAGTAAPFASDFWMSDPAAEAQIRVVHPGKTIPRKTWANSQDCRLLLPFEYTMSDPSSSDITVTLYKLVGSSAPYTETAMTGYIGIPLSNFSVTRPIGSTLWGKAQGEITIAGADISDTDQVFARVSRACSGGLFAQGFTPVMRAGVIVSTYGQSLSTKFWQNNPTLTWSTAGSPLPGGYVNPPNSWQVDGSNDAAGGSPVTAITRRVVGSSCTQASYIFSKSPQGYFCFTLASYLGHSNISFIRAGYGGVTYLQRSPLDKGGDAGINTFVQLLDGLDLAGDLNILWLNGGTYDVDHTPAPPTLSDAAQAAITRQALLDQVNAIEAYVGHPIQIMLCPPPWMYTGSVNSRMDVICRMLWALCDGGVYTNLGSTFTWGDNANDIQHTATNGSDTTGDGGNASDGYHPTFGPSGWAEMGRRAAIGVANILGVSSTNRVGPDIFAVQSWTAATVTVRIDKKGASTLTLSPGCTGANPINTCGFQFTAGDTSFASGNLLTPSAMPTIADIDTQFADVTFTFSGTPFSSPSAKPCVAGPRGVAPYNPALVSGISVGTMANMSMIQGVFTGENYNIPVRRLFNSTGDCVVGS